MMRKGKTAQSIAEERKVRVRASAHRSNVGAQQAISSNRIILNTCVAINRALNRS